MQQEKHNNEQLEQAHREELEQVEQGFCGQVEQDHSWISIVLDETLYMFRPTLTNEMPLFWSRDQCLANYKQANRPKHVQCLIQNCRDP